MTYLLLATPDPLPPTDLPMLPPAFAARWYVLCSRLARGTEAGSTGSSGSSGSSSRSSSAHQQEDRGGSGLLRRQGGRMASSSCITPPPTFMLSSQAPFLWEWEGLSPLRSRCRLTFTPSAASRPGEGTARREKAEPPARPLPRPSPPTAPCCSTCCSLPAATCGLGHPPGSLPDSPTGLPVRSAKDNVLRLLGSDGLS